MSPSRWQEVAELFERVLDCPPQERAALLDEACGARDSLRTEVESLLAAHRSAGESFLDEAALARQAAAVLPQGIPPDLSGQVIKHFVLRERLGVGGMGEVYLAEDTVLRRLVALKILSSQVRLDEENLRRFAREARAASLLNHPNITTVYEFGEDSGRPYIATEYVEGQTLRTRLEQGGLPLDEALTIADQVLAALASAHAVGIIHRDIKPENLMLRPDGIVKVLDFGIAKLTASSRPAAATQFRTEQGIVLGTPGYMSPEQARAQDVSVRSDLFSFGVVFYEMLAGNLPFHIETKADYIATLLTTDPVPLMQVRPDLPLAYGALLNRLLAREANERPASAEETRTLLSVLPRQLLSQPAAWWVSHRRRLAWVVAVLLCCVLAGFGIWRWREKVSASAALRAWRDLSRIRRTEIYSNRIERGLSSPAFSPDGQWIALDKVQDGSSHLYLLPRQGGMPQQLTFGPVTDTKPIWSPDGQRLAFTSNRAGLNQWGIWSVQRVGGTLEMLCPLPSSTTALVAWRVDAQGERLYFATQNNLQVLNLRDRSTQSVTQLPSIAGDRLEFSLAPNGEKVVYSERRDDGVYLCVLDLQKGQPLTLYKNQEGFRSLHWLPDGKNLAFVMSVAGTLQPHLFSLSEGKAYSLNLGNDDFADIVLTNDGQTMLGRSESQYANISAINLDGRETTYTTEKELHLLPLPSPDGKSVLYHSSSSYIQYGGKLLEKELIEQMSTRQRATLSLYAKWSPDGQRLAYVHPSANQHELFMLDVTSATEHLLVPKLMPIRYLPLPYYFLSSSFSWMSDSQHLVYISREVDRCQLWKTNVTHLSAQPLTPPSPSKTFYYSPVCSPAGQRVAFISTGRKNDSQSGSSNQILIAEDGQIATLYETRMALQILGWLSNDEFLIGEGRLSTTPKPQQVQLMKCRMMTRRCQPVAQLPLLFIPSLQISPDTTTVAFVTESQKNQNIQLFNLISGQIRSLTNNSDPGLFYAGLQWAPDSQRLFFSKQNVFEILTLIELR